MQRRHFTLAALACAMFMSTPAFAHDVAPRTFFVHDGYVALRHRGVAPHWLRMHRPFQRWYRQSRYRYVKSPDWLQLYDLYRIEVHQYGPVRYYGPVRHVHHRGCPHDHHRRHRGHRGR